MEEMSVTQVAELLGKTDRTIRNYIKDGRIKARRIENQFGWEYRVYDLGDLEKLIGKADGQMESPSEEGKEVQPGGKAEIQPETKTETALQIVSQENNRLWDENRNLREVNNRLAYDLGTRDQKIKELEQELTKMRNLLAAPAENSIQPDSPEIRVVSPKPWWKRLFHR